VLKGELLIWRTKNQARDQGTVQLKDSTGFKSVQTWFLGNWTLDSGPNWALDSTQSVTRDHLTMVQTWAPNRQILSLEGPSQKTCQIGTQLEPQIGKSSHLKVHLKRHVKYATRQIYMKLIAQSVLADVSYKCMFCTWIVAMCKQMNWTLPSHHQCIIFCERARFH
jgi:hypothetical protein